MATLIDKFTREVLYIPEPRSSYIVTTFLFQLLRNAMLKPKSAGLSMAAERDDEENYD